MHGAVQEILPSIDEEAGCFVSESRERLVERRSPSGEKLNEWNCPPIDIINEVVRFVKPHVSREPRSDCGLEGAEDSGRNGFHPGYVH